MGLVMGQFMVGTGRTSRKPNNRVVILPPRNPTFHRTASWPLSRQRGNQTPQFPLDSSNPSQPFIPHNDATRETRRVAFPLILPNPGAVPTNQQIEYRRTPNLLSSLFFFVA
ncbi:hypothetical protein AKJ16_DCAP06859 [Drosera capensis]